MKTIIAVACIICAFACIQQISALPVADTELESLVSIDDAIAAGEHDVVASRQKRATCDLLSFTGVNHAACAAHCVVKGFRGGYCNGKAVCVCRH